MIVNVQECYFEWLTKKVFRFTNDRDNFLDLLNTLHTIEFTWSISKDSNRYDDGKELKKTFCYETGLDSTYSTMLGDKCSMLEMMVALAIRCEVSIMSNLDYGDRTWLWFKVMLESLGLIGQNNDNFSESYVIGKINMFLNHEYTYNGNGSLFVVRNPVFDMRQAELWLQMSWYLSENYM